jgi:hypothetical protein
MQEQDMVSKEFFKDKSRMADLFNGFICNGREAVLPENVQEIDTVQSRMWKDGSEIRTNVNIMDGKRRLTADCQVVIVILQEQTNIHYAMPVRVMNQDATDYYNQWKEIQREHRKKQDLTGAEFLSGISKNDKLLPVISIVIYFGSEPWDGPRTLKEMLDLSDCPEDIQKMIADYPINLLEVRTYETLENFHTDLRVVFGFLQNASEKERLKKYMEEHSDELSNMAEDAYDMIAAMSNSKDLKKLQRVKENPEGGCNMGDAISELIKDGKEEGEKQGRNQINHLIQKLYEDGRQKDLLRSLNDTEFQDRLLEEYGLRNSPEKVGENSNQSSGSSDV